MNIITTTGALTELCDRLGAGDYITIDTEFMRETTFWPKLCLVQIAGSDEAAIIDTLAEGVDLAPLGGLLADPSVVKVFHAARQDIEIFYHLFGRVPAPLFDSQVAAMVCGFGDSVGYETLVARVAKAKVDKSSRFTDWSRRPLSERQLTYALADVTHLRVIYDKLNRRLAQSGRAHWLEEEFAILTDPATYDLSPDEAWRRLKLRNSKPRFVAVVKALAAWREREAQRRDVPRNRVIRDEVLLQIASHPPADAAELAKVRGLNRSIAEGRQGAAILAAIVAGLAMPEDQIPSLAKPPPGRAGTGPVVELLKVLIKYKAEEHGVAQKLIATVADLERIAADDEEADVVALKGWRREVFGADAVDLKRGRLALAVAGNKITLIRTAAATAAADD